MIRRIPPSVTLGRRAATLAAGVVLTAGVLSGCSSDGASTSCGVDACTVTFDRGADAKVNVLGVDAKLVGADGDNVTVEVAGERLTLTTGQQAAEAGGLYVSVDSVTDSEVKVRIGRNQG
jgi:hypothetical protein